jgi:hypothetical protein
VYSCSSSECKELLVSLGWREVAVALDDAAPVVPLAKFSERLPQFLRGPEGRKPGPAAAGSFRVRMDRSRQFGVQENPSAGDMQGES